MLHFIPNLLYFTVFSQSLCPYFAIHYLNCLIKRTFFWLQWHIVARTYKHFQGSLVLTLHSFALLLHDAQSCLTLCDPMDCSPPGSSVYRPFQSRILEWVAISFSRESSAGIKPEAHVSPLLTGRFVNTALPGKTNQIPLDRTSNTVWKQLR